VDGEDIDGAFGRTYHGAMHNLPRMLYVSYSSLTGFVCHTPKTGAGRLFGFFYILFCMLLCAAYTANLASIMTIMASETVTTNLDTLVSTGHPICVLKGTAYGNWLKTESPWSGTINIIPTDSSDITPNLRSGVCDGVVGTGMLIDYYLSLDENCDMASNGDQVSGLQV
jgi:hypothetical protein